MGQAKSLKKKGVGTNTLYYSYRKQTMEPTKYIYFFDATLNEITDYIGSQDNIDTISQFVKTRFAADLKSTDKSKAEIAALDDGFYITKKNSIYEKKTEIITGIIYNSKNPIVKKLGKVIKSSTEKIIIQQNDKIESAAIVGVFDTYWDCIFSCKTLEEFKSHLNELLSYMKNKKSFIDKNIDVKNKWLILCGKLNDEMKQFSDLAGYNIDKYIEEYSS